MRRSNNSHRQVVATRRKRLVHDRRKKIVDRRAVFFQLTVEDDASVPFK
ncbi:hypothetical protein [Thalassotalea eurytherma]|uniref:50S ribosomal protein L18 n=1 Tax=Thalassotalea eurytherma TaxID=1144278 RepID=A0ABQ6H004_9GAMM|nr:hypothetical protein [Thalassotalea eurytherma]GLX81521.1 hypothetical protein theurythT_09730 [Thalassotalea eurytherma]